jgi:hypothetical protein
VQLLHRGPDAVYVDVAGRCVGVVGTRATAVPCALRASLDRLPDVVAASLSGGVLHLDDEPLAVGRLVDVSVPRLPLVEELAQQGSRDPRRQGTHPASGPGSRGFETGAERPPQPPLNVAELVGRGDGLTPYGDDVLCGWLAVHRAAGRATPEVDTAVRDLMGTTTLLSATLLDCAMHGEVIPEFAAWLGALGTPAEESQAALLARVGHTSGRGLLEGATRALDELERVAA